jgi:hypothetical protein
MATITRRASATMLLSAGAATALHRPAVPAPIPLPLMHNLGKVCQKSHDSPPVCVKDVDVFQVDGRQAAHFLAKLATDADGAPRAYHPCDKVDGDNAGKAFDVLTSVKQSDLHGIQGQGEAIGPAPGYYVSGTTLFDPEVKDENNIKKENNAARWVDASIVPYFVLPKSFPVPPGTRLADGCVGLVVDTRSGRSSGAIMADHGNNVGEGSIALVRRLKLPVFIQNRFPKVSGYDEPEHFDHFFYLVFPDVVIAPRWSIKTIQQIAEALFVAWGGDDLLKRMFPAMPARIGPDFPPLPDFPPPGQC